MRPGNHTIRKCAVCGVFPRAAGLYCERCQAQLEHAREVARRRHEAAKR